MKAFFGRYALRVALYAFAHRADIAKLVQEAHDLVVGAKAATK